MAEFSGYSVLGTAFKGTLQVVSTVDTPVNADALPTFRIYGPDGFVEDGTCAFKDSKAITAATNATPIVVSSTAHGLTTGSLVTITGVAGNTSANGTFIVTKVTDNSFSLDGTTGNGAYTTGGVWNKTGLYSYEADGLGATGYEAGESYHPVFDYEVSSVSKGDVHSFVVS